MDPNISFILTKIHSFKEGNEKIKWLLKNNIKQKVILVPYYLKKTDMVSAKDNILVDDCLKNLKEWSDSLGHGVFYDMNDDNIDSWNQPNVDGYERVLSLEKFRHY